MDVEAIKAIVNKTGIGGASLIFFLFVIIAILTKTRFSPFSEINSYRVFRLTIILASALALSGVITYTYINQPPPQKKQSYFYIRVIEASAREPMNCAEVSIDGRPDLKPQAVAENGEYRFDVNSATGKFEGVVRIKVDEYKEVSKLVSLAHGQTEVFQIFKKTHREYKLTGKILGKDGTPIADALVTAGHLSVHSNSIGYFELIFDKEPADNSVLRVTKPGYIQFAQYFDSAQRDVNVTLDEIKAGGASSGLVIRDK